MVTQSAVSENAATAHTQGKFQLFSPLSDEKYAALKEDIRQNGVLVPVEIDQHGQTLDGHHRIRAWEELTSEGVELADYTRVIRHFASDDDREEHAAKLNSQRRDISTDDKKRLALRWRERGWSYRRIGAALGVDHSTVYHWVPQATNERSTVEDSTVDLPERVIGLDGKSRPATMPKPRPAVWATSGREQERALTSLEGLFGEDDEDATPNVVPVNRRTGEIMTSTDVSRRAKEQKRQAVRDENAAKVSAVKPLTEYVAGQTFQTIVIDPPWDWGDEGDVDQFGRGRPIYDTMSADDLAAMPIGDVAETNSHLYLWITNRSLPKGFALLEAWGFRYITTLTWCKPSIGMGNYYRGSTEHLLFGVRGSLPLQERNIGTWFTAKRGERHSEKPVEAYELIERASPGPWLDIFARTERQGWVTWGEGAQ